MLGVFRVILKLQELFNGGVVRLSEGPGAYRLYQYDRKKVLRISAMMERMQAYLRAFGYTNCRPAPGAHSGTASSILCSIHHIQRGGRAFLPGRENLGSSAGARE